ncbi:IPExxxVDY family protein [Lutibacter sp. TH_r2]|uniref:IPExxxVDY family protein n=1 Tax=Lutibacter sp. TH_r2 TaxID=3082083 RepID=UPI002954EBDB|nr:IPExxxVDY family protein [Lutibacter sp. TH_r2]MDV7186733.1 IPExxxVDY family protein [Lutibacter sp. TH_r2]
MAILTFELDDEEFTLIGIHSTEEDYKLAYLLNQQLNTKFIRFQQTLDFQNSTAEFPLFEFKDNSSLENYYLINNKDTQVKENKNTGGLFNGNYTTISYLIPEKKRVDYFLKIEGCNRALALNLINKLNNLKQIITSYIIETNTLKSKNHLIF